MRIERIELFSLRLPLKHAYETSGAVMTHTTRVVARIEAEGAVGWGESVANETPWYSPETPATVRYVLETFAAPALLREPLERPEDAATRLAWIRGHNMAKATLEMATWDLFAMAQDRPLSALLGGTRQQIPCGVGIGLQPSMEALFERIDRELGDGYLRVKLKIKPGQDIAIAAAVRKRYPDLPFMVDANSAYSIADAPVFERIDMYGPTMIEQPLASDDLIDHAELQRRIRTPVCLDESIESPEDARKMIAIGAGRIVNIKAGRVGGHTASKVVHDVCMAAGVPVWCGGMLEMGIGRAHNVHLASLPNFSLPGDVTASKRYYDTEIIGEPFEVQQGTIRVPTGPGIGVTVLEDVIRKLAGRYAELRA